MTAAAKKATTKKTTAKKVETPAPTGRAAVLEELADLGWDGPTSYTATVCVRTCCRGLQQGSLPTLATCRLAR